MLSLQTINVTEQTKERKNFLWKENLDGELF